MMQARLNIWMVRFCLLAICLITTLNFIAQKVVLERNVTRQMERTYQDSSGPNGNWFAHSIWGVGLILPINQNDSAAIKENSQSNIFYYGGRGKVKLNNTFSIGFDLFYMHQRYQIKQSDSINIFSLGLKNNSQKLNFNSVGLGGYVRINFGKRGNIIGRYLDIGADINYVFSERLFAKNKVDAATNGGADIVKTSYTHLDYTKQHQGFGMLRFGVNNICLFTRFRVTDLFVHSNNFYSVGKVPELPLVTVGLEFSKL